MNHSVLIVDDEPAVLAALQRALRQRFGARLAVHAESDAIAALSLLRERSFDILVSDLRMPVIDGISFLTLAAGLHPVAVRMILTGSADFETAQRAINESGVFRYLTKPWNDSELAAHIEAAMLLVPRATGTPQEQEARRMEALEPGITKVEWGPGGEVLMPDLLAVKTEN
jgi:YesN/AraC family two-component response regulator